MLNKQYKHEKFDPESRTFETRLQFIHDIFAEKYTQTEILAGCIEHKLDRNLFNYLSELDSSLKILAKRNPMTVLKRIDTIDKNN